MTRKRRTPPAPVKTAEPVTRHPAGTATYPGDCRHMVGEVKGPTTYGSLVVAVDARHFAGQDVTGVGFAHCTDADVDTIVSTGRGRLDLVGADQ